MRRETTGVTESLLQAAAFMKNVQIFNFAGWKAVFGL